MKRHRTFITNNSSGGTYANRSSGTDFFKKGNVETAAAADQLHSTLIGPEKGLKTRDVETGREFSYTATKDQCPKCANHAAAKAEVHRPKCYSGRCKTCGLYGHKQISCQQHASTFVPILTIKEEK